MNELEQKLNIVLDFVERWNKQDEDIEVAQAAAEIPKLLEQYVIESVETFAKDLKSVIPKHVDTPLANNHLTIDIVLSRRKEKL